MLYANTAHGPRIEVDATSASHPGGIDHLLSEAIWLDLVSPTDAERAAVERATKLRVPAQAEVAEIESSSRLTSDGEVFTLSTPMTYRNRDNGTSIGPLGLVLAADRLITLRFAEMPVFDTFAERFANCGEQTSAGVFTALLEAVVDRLADVLEHVAAELEGVSHDVFGEEVGRKEKASTFDTRLRGTLRSIGRQGERLANLRDSLIGVQRVATYVHEMGRSLAWLDPDHQRRCNTLRKDVASLAEYDTQLSNKVQFLLDATLGFINIEQNNGIKVLTVVSVVGVPPTLVASMYGMNFKNMPELNWEYGYPYGLTLIVLSAIVPLIWFKRRGWI